MFAAAIFFFARVIRWPMVVSDTRNAEAISGTVSPPSRRRVSATRASGARAGWQQVKISRSRSSSTGPVGAWGVSSAIIRACWYLASRCDSRRILSMPLRTAVVVSHPPGLGGTPSTGHRSTAASSASAAASSATSMSPNRRIREATTRPCSSRKIRSISRSVVTSGWKGRTSTRPSHAADASIASFSAASRSGASRIQNPPIHSFASAYGPSVMIGSGPVASTVVVVSIGSRPPPNTQMPASVTFWLKASTWVNMRCTSSPVGISSPTSWCTLNMYCVMAFSFVGCRFNPSTNGRSPDPTTLRCRLSTGPGKSSAVRVSARDRAGSSPGHP